MIAVDPTQDTVDAGIFAQPGDPGVVQIGQEYRGLHPEIGAPTPEEDRIAAAFDEVEDRLHASLVINVVLVVVIFVLLAVLILHG